jgi:hypothetical protein
MTLGLCDVLTAVAYKELRLGPLHDSQIVHNLRWPMLKFRETEFRTRN